MNTIVLEILSIIAINRISISLNSKILLEYLDIPLIFS